MAAWAEVKKRVMRRKEEMERLLKRPILRKTLFVVVVMVVYVEMGRGLYRVGVAEKCQTALLNSKAWHQGCALVLDFIP